MPPSRKPKVARSAASRAKSGDVGAQVEVLIEWIGDVLAGKERMTFLQMLTTIGVLIAAGAACVGAYLLLGSKVVAIKPSDSAQLKKVFYTGEPWLIECTSSSSASPMVYGAESALKGVQIGTLDCGAMLPSGKTTFERFKLKEPNYGPVLLAAANGERPQIAPRNVLTDTALVSWVKTATKAKMFAPTNGAQFESQCLRKPWCLVVLTAAGRVNDMEKKALQALAESERKLRVVKVDASKANLFLDLPGGALAAPTGHKATLVLLKELEGVAGADAKAEAKGADAEAEDASGTSSGRTVIATHLTGGLSDDMRSTGSAIAAALSAAEATPAGFSELVKRPALRPKRVPQASKPQTVTPEPRKGSSDTASKTLTDAELKALREERQRQIKEAELNRRAKMAEEEAGAANIVEEVGDGGADSADASSLEADDDDSVDGGADEEVEEEAFD